MGKVRLVIVEWDDSRQPDGKWQFLNSISFPKVCRCVSVGYLIEDGKDKKILAPNCADIDNINDMQVSGIITIPSTCIRSIRQLREAKGLPLTVAGLR